MAATQKPQDDKQTYFAEYRLRKRAEGMCIEHWIPFAPLADCPECRPEDMASEERAQPELNADGRLEACYECKNCGRHYHKGRWWNDLLGHPTKRHGIQPGLNNSLFDFDKSDGKGKFFSICGDCRKEDGFDDWTKAKYRNPSNWPNGRCDLHRPKARIIEGIVNGMDCSDRYAEAGPRKRQNKASFTCENCGEKAIAYLSTRRRGSWRRLCSKCQNLLGPPTKINEDVSIHDAEGRLVLILFFSQEDEHKRVKIYYGACQHERWAPRQTALAYLHEYQHGRPIKGQCQECRNNPLAAALRIAERAQQAASSNGNGQKNGGAGKRGVGRPPEDPKELEKQHNKLRERFEGVITELSKKLPEHKIRRPAIRAEYELRGEKIDDTTITKRVQLLYGDGISVADAVSLVLKQNREINSGN